MSTTTAKDAVAQWDDLVAKHVGRGMSKATAIQAAAEANPQLHAEYLAEFNRRARTASVSASAPAAHREAIANWNNRVAGFIEKGLAKKDAILKAASAFPDMHTAYLAAYNERAAERRQAA
jgi:hypothetical protein